MSFDFVIPEMVINNDKWTLSPFRFFRRGFLLNTSSGSEPTWKDIILHGATALTLVNSKQNGLNYLKLFGGTELLPETYIDSVTLDGKCEQSGTPTPTVPVDIVCNNGVIKYSLNELNTNDIEIGYYRTSATGALTESPYNFVTGYMPVKPNQSYVFFGRRKSDDRLSSYNRIHWFNANKEFISTNSYTKDTIGTGVAPANAVFAQCSCNESGATSRETTQAIVDNYNWVFELGTAEVPYIPYVEGGLYTFGTVETITSTGKNLLNADVDNTTIASTPTSAINIDFNMWYKGMAYNGYANTHSVTNFSCGKGLVTFTSNGNSYGCVRFIKLKPNTQYTVSCANPTDEHKCAIMCYIDNGDGTYTSTTYIKTPAKLPYQFTTNDNVVYGLDFYSPTNTPITYNDIQLEESSIATTYEPYYNGGTATAEMLLSVGDYTDTQELLSGVVTRNLGIKVLDGTEDGWAKSNNSFSNTQICPDKIDSKKPMLCTHFVYNAGTTTTITDLKIGCSVNGTNVFFRYDTISTVEDWQTWLVNQYQAGTPVIIVYPLATETTETVSGQVLNKEPLTVAGSLSGLVATVVSSTHTTPMPEQPLAINCNNGVLKASSQLLVNGNCKENVNNWTVTGLTYNNTDNYISFTNNTNAAIYLRCSTNNVRKDNHVYAYLITGKIDSGTAGWGSRNAGAATNPLTTTEQTLVFIDTFPTNGNGEPWIYIQAERTFTLNKKSGFRIYDLTALGLAGIITTPEQAINYFGNKYEEPKTAIAEGTVETVRVHSKNLWTGDFSQFDNIGGEGNTYAYFKLPKENTYYTLSVTAKKDYTASNTVALGFSGIGGSSSGGIRWVIPTTGTVPKGETRSFSNYASKFLNYVCMYKTNSTTFDYISECFDIQLELGSTATDYEPYFNGGSATAEMLLSLLTKGGDSIYAQNTQNVTTGEVTRNVGIKVFDGTETWNRGSNQDVSGNYVFYMSLTDRKIQDTNMGLLCSHFKFRGTVSYSTLLQDEFCINQTIQYIYFDGGTRTTIDEWKAYLASQYANGTPVIVVYPLATATTETVTAQPLTIQAGTNIVEITQASMDNLELEVSYKAGVEVTVTEIENAQLDNSVEVTVNE
jgi:hypothetical protein